VLFSLSSGIQIAASMVFTSIVFPFLASNLLSVVPLLLAVFLLNQKGFKSGLLRFKSGQAAFQWMLSTKGTNTSISSSFSGKKVEVKRKKEEVNKKEKNEEDEETQDEVVKPALGEVTHVPFNWPILSDEVLIQRSRQFYEDVNKRRTMRFYSERPVPRAVIDNLLRAAGTSPSGAHTEPWTYVVVADPDMKAAVRDIIEREEEINYTQRMGNKWTTDLAPLKTDWNKPYLTAAPYLVLLFKQTHGYMPNGEVKVHYYNEISCAISAGIFITAANQAGLVTLTSTPLNCGPALRSLLEKPDNEKLMMLMPVGFPAEGATVPNIARKPVEEFAVYI